MEAYRLPKDEEGSNIRSIAIRKATIEARQSRTMKFGINLCTHWLAKECNANALTVETGSGVRNISMKWRNLMCELTQTTSQERHRFLQTASQNLLTECNQVMSEITQLYTNRLGW